MTKLEEDDHRGIGNHGNFTIRLRRRIYRYRGLLASFLVACLSSVVTILVTFVQGTANSSQLVFARGFCSCVVSLILLIALGIEMKPTSRQEFRGLAVQGVSSSVVVWTLYYAYQNMPTGDAAAIVYGYIAFSALFGRIFLKEPLRWFEAIMVAITIIGIILIIRPPFLFGSHGNEGASTLLPAMSALCTSLSSAFLTVAFRALGKLDTNPIKSLLYCSICIMALSSISITLNRDWQLPGCLDTRLLVVTVSLLGYLTMLIFAYALSVENIVVVTVITVNEIYLVFFADIFLLGTSPNLFSILGIFMIISSSIGISYRKFVQMRRSEDKNHISDVIQLDIGEQQDEMNTESEEEAREDVREPGDPPLPAESRV